MPILAEYRADDWELRCRFNRQRFFERWQAGEFRVEYGDAAPASPNAGQPPNTISQIAYYYDRATNEEVAKVHFYLLESGEIGASGRHDPKRVLIDGILYRQRKGPAVNRDPSLKYSWWRGGYLRFRRIKCWILGR
jgi:hypothetical protein